MARNRKAKHSFWKRIRFKYRISVINENTLEEIWKIRASIFTGALLFLTIASLLIAITSMIIIATPIRYYLPGYLDSEVREKAIRSALAIDSLEDKLKGHDIYAANLRKILDGTMGMDSVNTVSDTLNISADDPLLQKSQTEEDFVLQYGEDEKYNLSILSSPNTATEAIILFAPMPGVVTGKFNPKTNHFGVIIQAKASKTISSILEGTIVYAGYEINSGNVIQIQHKNGFLSIYKNCGLLVKKTGDAVKTGEAIATMEIEANKEGKGLYFELWYNGVAVNPENYITF